MFAFQKSRKFQMMIGPPLTALLTGVAIWFWAAPGNAIVSVMGGLGAGVGHWLWARRHFAAT